MNIKGENPEFAFCVYDAKNKYFLPLEPSDERKYFLTPLGQFCELRLQPFSFLCPQQWEQIIYNDVMPDGTPRYVLTHSDNKEPS